MDVVNKLAERRTISTKISLSEQVDNLSNWAQLLYTWSIIHSDDIGVLPRKPKILKAKVFPLKENLKKEHIETFIKEIIENGLFQEVDIGGKKYLRVINFSKYQTLKRDRNPQVIFDYNTIEARGNKMAIKEVYKGNWSTIEELESTWKPVGIQTVSEVKRSEEKRSEEKSPPNTPKKEGKKPTPKEKVQKHRYGVHKNVLLTDDEKKKLIEKFGKPKAKKLVEKLSDYIATYKGGNKYKSHYLVILQWERKDTDGSEYGKNTPYSGGNAQTGDRVRQQVKRQQYEEDKEARNEASKNNEKMKDFEAQKKKLLESK